jgi:polyferredoxin
MWFRDRGVMARVVDAGKTENVYRLQLMNATESTQRYKVSVNGLAGLVITSDDTVQVESTQARTLPVRVQAPFEAAKPGSHEIHFVIESMDSPGKLVEKSTFIIPQQ